MKAIGMKPVLVAGGKGDAKKICHLPFLVFVIILILVFDSVQATLKRIKFTSLRVIHRYSACGHEKYKRLLLSTELSVLDHPQ